MAYPRLRVTIGLQHATPLPRIAGELDSPFASPVHDLQAYLRDLPALLVAGVPVRKYPAAVRLLLPIAASISLWWLVVEVIVFIVR